MAFKFSYFSNSILLFFLFLIPLSSQAQSERTFLNVDNLVEEALQNNPEYWLLRKNGKSIRKEFLKLRPSKTRCLVLESSTFLRISVLKTKI